MFHSLSVCVRQVSPDCVTRLCAEEAHILAFCFLTGWILAFEIVAFVNEPSVNTAPVICSVPSCSVCSISRRIVCWLCVIANVL